MCLSASACRQFTGSNSGRSARNCSTTSRFSWPSTLQVAYTSRPPGLSKSAAARRIARCFAASSSIACGDCRHLRSGLRRSVPRPLHGASTSTRSILPARRFTLMSFSLAMICGCTLDNPERFSLGARFLRRFCETSKAYSRPWDCIIAPIIKVLPPAPAQKSTTISRRFGPTR